MMPSVRAPLALFALFAAGLGAAPAVAGVTLACRFEAGMVVVSGEAAGIAGDYVLDTGTARSVLHSTRAEMAGITAPALTGDIRIGGLILPGRPLVVADLDARIWRLATPAGGIIGADALRDFVVDVDFAPCRVRLWRPAEARPTFSGRTLPLTWDAGRPVAPAAVEDGARRLEGLFVLATGADAPARIADDLAGTPGAVRVSELYPEGVWLARLPRVEFAGATGVNVAAGLAQPEGEAAGVLGGEVLSRFRLRFDFPGGLLTVDSPIPNEKGPRRAPRPRSRR
jgi:hypothetical protein